MIVLAECLSACRLNSGLTQLDWEVTCLPYECHTEIVAAMEPSRTVLGELGERRSLPQPSHYLCLARSLFFGTFSDAIGCWRSWANSRWYRRVGATNDGEPALKNQQFPLPLTSTLLAFEAVARNVSVNRAALELSTSQSAISRHIRSLEHTLGVKLLARAGRGIALTDSGHAYYLAVQRAMNDLESTAYELRTRKTRLTIACTSAISTLVVLPVLSKLKQRLGEVVSVALAVYNGPSYEERGPHGPRMPDIVFEGMPSETSPGLDAVKMLNEEILPVASPEFVDRFGAELSRNPKHWSTTPRLEMSARDRGWATWNKWFRAHGCEAPDAPVEVFEDYAHLLRAAAEGGGLAIGRNGFLSDYFVDGRLVAIRDTWLRTGLALYAVPTETGKQNSASDHSLKELAKLLAEMCEVDPVRRTA